MAHSWDELICNYFKENVLKTLGDYFENNGFDHYEITNIGGIVFKSKDGCFIEISYEIESSPKYTPTVIVGVGNKFDEKGNPNCVPLWFVTPDSSLARSYSSWKFSSENQLQDVLMQLKKELLEKYGIPLCTDISLLKEKINSFARGRT